VGYAAASRSRVLLPGNRSPVLAENMASRIPDEAPSPLAVKPRLARGARRQWWWLLAAGALSIAIYQFLPDGLARDIGYVAVGLAGATAIGVGVRLNQPVRRWPWYLMAVGQFTWVSGDAVGSWAADVAHLDVFPSPADPFYLLAYPVLALGLLLLIRGRRLRGDWSGLLDSAIVTVGLGILSWVLLAQPTIVSYREKSLAATVVAVAYPAADIVLLAILVRFLATPGTWTASLRLLLIAVALLIGADTAASALSLTSFGSTGRLDFLWMLSYVVWGGAALHPSMRALSQPAPPQASRFNRTRLAALTVAVLIAPGTVAAQYLSGRRLDVWAVVIGSVAMCLLVVARMNAFIGSDRRGEPAMRGYADGPGPSTRDAAGRAGNRRQLGRVC
jgi:hypothetical protein